MRTLLVTALALAACDSGRRADKPADPAATGTLVFDPRPGEDVQVFMATEAEVMKSAPLLQRVRDDLRIDELTAEAITATRKPGTLILEVSVRNPEPLRAAVLCNALMRSYFEYRLQGAQTLVAQQQQVIAEQLDKRPDDAELRRKLEELGLEQRLYRNDVRLLEPCKAPPRRAAR